MTILAITSLYEAYVRQVADTLNDLNNVLYKITGDASSSSRKWQIYMINYLKGMRPPNPIGMSYLYLGSIDDLLTSPTEWILVSGSDVNSSSTADYKVVCSDVDPKLLRGGTSYALVWKSFVQGLNSIYPESDLLNHNVDENLLSSMGYTLRYSQLVDLLSMSPGNELCSSRYCQVNPQLEYLVYLSSGTMVRVNLSAASGNFAANWFSPQTGQTTSGGTVSAGIPILFTSPFDGGAVLYLKAMRVPSSQNSSSVSIDLSLSDTMLIPAATARTSILSLSNTRPITLTQGSLATTRISATLAALRKRSVTFSVSGLPQEVSGTFSPNSYTPNCTTELKLTASSSAAVGSYVINVTGKNKQQYQGTTSFTLSVTLVPTVAEDASTITPNSGAFTNSVTVTLQSGTSGVTIYYTTNGSNPTQSSKVYNVPFAFTATSPSSEASAWFTKEGAGTATLTWADNFNNETGFAMERKTRTAGTQIATVGSNANLYTHSGLITGNTYCYRVNAFNLAGVSAYTNEACKNIASPTSMFYFSLNTAGHVSVTQGQSVTNTAIAILSSGPAKSLSFATSDLPTGATASYTTSSFCNPTCSRALNIGTSTATPTGFYTVTATVTGGGVTKPTSFGLTRNSPIVATVATPSIIPHGGSFAGSASVTLQTATSDASIYYTTDGSTPTQSSILYTGSVNLTSSATVKVIAAKSGSNPSIVESASFTVVTPPAQLTLTWQDYSTNESNFGVERKMGSDGTYTQIALVAANTTSYVDTGVTYCYGINATNSVGTSAYVNEVCASASSVDHST